MSLKLNLGAGRVILPATKIPAGDPDNPAHYTVDRVYQHLMPLPPSAFEPGWVNVDKYPNPGIAEALDLFQFPWVRSSNGSPWNDNRVDEIYCSHIIEHIPHQGQIAPTAPPSVAKEYREMAKHLDGWFLFFYECWRVLKPDGLLHIVAPFGMSVAGVADPSHTRLIVSGSFAYLSRNGDDQAPFDYHLPMWFEIDSPPLYRFRGEWAHRIGGVTPEEATRLAYTYFDVCDEIRVTLRAVKPKE